MRSNAEEDHEWHHEGLSFLFLAAILHDVCKDNAIAYIGMCINICIETNANCTTGQLVVDQKVQRAIKQKC